MARALRFYGGTLDDWLNVPLATLHDMLDAANVIESRERLARIVDGQVAGGVVKKSNANAHVRNLRRVAYPGPKRAATTADLGALGIKVVRQ